jgi:TolB-like protein/Tfp pilus assembly protein PilF
VAAALVKALATSPSDRFASAGDFVKALTAKSSSEASTPSVAVLPFRNLSANPENEFFVDGITEDVITQLSKIRSLKVISRTSVMPFRKREQELRQIGATLQVATLLDGSVRWSGDRVRIVAQLIDVEADKNLWSETYDRQLTDIFAIQSDVALQIASALQTEMSLSERNRIQREPTKNVRAYQFFLRGRQSYSRYTEEGIRQGIGYFRQAIAVDPRYAVAHTGLALAFAELAAGQGGGDMQPELAYRQALEAVTMALSLDNQLGEAHSVLALLKFSHDFDWKGAEEEFKLALELSPGAADIYDHYCWLCSAEERYDEAVTLAMRAQELDPLTHRADLAATLLRAGRHREALDSALTAIQFEPDYPLGLSTLGWAYLKNGMVEQGIGGLERASRLTPGNTMHLAQLGQAYAMTGKPEKALAVLQELEELAKQRYVSPYHLAYVYTGMGEHDRAVELLERAYRERAGSVYGIKGSFLFTDLRPHPRFQALLKQMNLA